MALPALPVSLDEADAAAAAARDSGRRLVLLAGLGASTGREALRWLTSAGFEVALADDLARGPLQVAEILAAAGRLAQPRLGVPILLTGLSGSHRASTLT